MLALTYLIFLLNSVHLAHSFVTVSCTLIVSVIEVVLLYTVDVHYMYISLSTSFIHSLACIGAVRPMAQLATKVTCELAIITHARAAQRREHAGRWRQGSGTRLLRETKRGRG